MLRILSTALAVLAITTASLCYPARTRAALTPGITLIGKGIVSGTALDKSGLTGTLFIDLLDPDLNLAATIPEKIEGLAWGPDLPDGRHVGFALKVFLIHTGL